MSNIRNKPETASTGLGVHNRIKRFFESNTVFFDRVQISSERGDAEKTGPGGLCRLPNDAQDLS